MSHISVPGSRIGSQAPFKCSFRSYSKKECGLSGPHKDQEALRDGVGGGLVQIFFNRCSFCMPSPNFLQKNCNPSPHVIQKSYAPRPTLKDMIRIIKRDQGEKPSEPSSNTTGKSQTLQIGSIQFQRSSADQKSWE